MANCSSSFLLFVTWAGDTGAYYIGPSGAAISSPRMSARRNRSKGWREERLRPPARLRRAMLVCADAFAFRLRHVGPLAHRSRIVGDLLESACQAKRRSQGFGEFCRDTGNVGPSRQSLVHSPGFYYYVTSIRGLVPLRKARCPAERSQMFKWQLVSPTQPRAETRRYRGQAAAR